MTKWVSIPPFHASAGRGDLMYGFADVKSEVARLKAEIARLRKRIKLDISEREVVDLTADGE